MEGLTLSEATISLMTLIATTARCNLPHSRSVKMETGKESLFGFLKT
jgi:hypothetical protein